MLHNAENNQWVGVIQLISECRDLSLDNEMMKLCETDNNIAAFVVILVEFHNTESRI